MGKVYEWGGYIIIVYPKDHRHEGEDIHCHVYFGDYHLKVWVPSLKFKVVSIKSPRVSVINVVKELVNNERNAIGKTWREYHGN